MIDGPGQDPKPAAAGFAMPPEWAPQAAVWLSWPHDPRLWPGKLDRIRGIFARLAALLAGFQEVRINAGPEHHAGIRALLDEAGADPAATQLFPHPTDDVWCRDHGPSFLKHRETGELAAVDWRFNAWGGKFEPHDRDDAVAALIARSLGLRCFSSRLVFEGGGLEVDGAGRVLTTRSVALNPNRNPGWSRAQVEAELLAMLGGDQVLWLPGGLAGDDTDGHIDTLTRFIAPGMVVTAVESDPADPNHRVLAENRALLAAAGLEIIDLPQPPPIAAPPGWRESRLPATYANFLLVNDGVIAPTYGQPGPDARALGIIGDCFPGRRVMAFDCREILLEGGAVHCLTQQQPA
jgi:agmatine deiminase